MALKMLITSIILLVLFFISGFVFLGLWVYRDAKARGINAPLWTAVALLVPDFIGLLLYFLIGRREAATPCPNCSAMVRTNSLYCQRCGHEMASARQALPKKPGKRLLIGFVACIIAFALSFAGMFVVIFKFDFSKSFDSYSALMMVQNSWGSKWDLSFKQLDGHMSHTLKIRNGAPKAITVVSELDGGSLTLEVTQDNTTSDIVIEKGKDYSVVDLTGFKDGSVKMTLVADGAQGKINVSWK